LAELAGGEQLEVLATDATAVRDFQAFCRQTGHGLLEHREVDGEFRFVLQKRLD